MLIAGESGSTGITIVALVIAVGVGIAIAVSNKEKTNSAVSYAERQVETTQRNRRDSMESMRADALSKGFVFSKQVSNPNNSSCLALDSEHKKFLIKTDSNWSIMPYSQLVSYELHKDGQSTLSSNAGNAIVGGLLFGTVGAIAGASGPKTVDKYCSQLSISIVDAAAQRYVIPLIVEKVYEGSPQYQSAIECARDMISILDVISKENDKLRAETILSRTVTPIMPEDNSSSKIQMSDSFEEIKKYKELLDMGIISQEEFEDKKKQLLNI